MGRMVFTETPTGARRAYRVVEGGWEPVDEPGSVVTLTAVLVEVASAAMTQLRALRSAAKEARTARRDGEDEAAAAYESRRAASQESIAAVHARWAATVDAVLAAHREVMNALLSPPLVEQYGDATELIDSADVGVIAGIGHHTAINYNSRGLLPEPIMVKGNSPLWTRGQIDRWVADRRERDAEEDSDRTGRAAVG